jgi:Ala-tRNA(Pro) deacylase
VGANEAYQRLISLLDAERARYHVIDHAPEGRTELVSQLRGNAVHDAAKCIILMLKIGKKVTKFILAVVPGDERVDLESVKSQKGASYAGFAESNVAEMLAGCVSGTILPFVFDPRLELIVDRSVAASQTMYFNAGRLDRSIALATEDYLRITKPQIATIAAR